jgi:hypothetical protein
MLTGVCDLATHETTGTLIRNGFAYCRMRAFSMDLPNQEQELLLENRIWFSDLARQDDIFEGRPLFRWEESNVTREELLAMSRRQDPSLPRDAREHLVDYMFARYSDPTERAIMKGWVEVDTEALYANSSVCCFFRNPCEPRFWSEYADRHRGYSLIFDFSIPWRMQCFRDHQAIQIAPMPVRYVDGFHRPVVTLTLSVRSGEEGFRELEKALLSKSEQWSDQREYRIVRVGMEAGHVEFPPGSLVGLALGHRMEQIHKDRLYALRAERKLSLPFYESPPSRTLYGMELLPVD